MKSKMKKLVSLVLAMAMVFTMSAVVFADAPEYSITITNANEGETYTAYKILDVTTSSGTTTSYAYTISSTSAWFSIVQNAKDASGNNLFEVVVSASDNTVYNVTATDYCTDEAVTYYFNTVTVPQSATAAATGTADSETLVLDIDSSGAGYYFVTTSTGALVTVDTAAKTASVRDKNPEPTVKKTVSDSGESGTYGKSNTAGIGDTVYFMAVISNINEASKIVFHDTMSTGLTFDGANSVRVYLDGTSVLTQGTSNDYEVTISGTDGCTFEIDFSDYLSDNASSLTTSNTLVIYYTATVNSNATIGSTGNPNEALISYGNDSKSEKSTTVTYVYEMNIFKYYDNSGTDTALSGASFVLYKDVDGTYYYATVDDKGIITGWVNSQTNATTLTSNDNGKIEIDGLDVGTYYLLETEAPSGYNKLTSAVTVTISADTDNSEILKYGSEQTTATDNTVKVENKSGSVLPSTGGIGTTIFYIVGAILVLGAGVVLVTRRRTARQ